MKKKKRKSIIPAVIILLIVLTVAAMVYIIGFHKEETVAVRAPQGTGKPVVANGKTAKEKSDSRAPVKEMFKKHKDVVASSKPVLKPPGKEKIVIAKTVPPRLPVKEISIIVDDIGYDMKPVVDLIEMDEEITFAILPLLPHSRDAGRLLHQAGREILLHLPMEPVSYPNEKPGSGALFTDMSDEEIDLQLEKNLASVPYAVGVNNHMGSKFMADEEKLTPVFRKLKNKNLFFIDSRTTQSSKTAAIAQKIHLTVASRKVFLDHEKEYDKIYRVLMEVAEAPAGSSPVILIGHPYPETVRAIRDARKVLREKGVSIIPVSRLIKNKKAQDAF